MPEAKSNFWKWIPSQIFSRADSAIAQALQRGDGSWQENAVSSPSLSRSRIQKLIGEGLVKQGDKILRCNSQLGAGLEITLELPPPRALNIEKNESTSVKILYEDEDLAVVFKPQGLTVHPSPQNTGGTLVNILLDKLSSLSGIGGVERPGIVHRLDRDTSGLMVVAKSDAAHIQLVKAFSKRMIQREYLAIAFGAPQWNELICKESIARNPQDRKKFMASKLGRHAESKFNVRRRFQYAQGSSLSLIGAKLSTGRTHQIRVHLTHLKHSIVGDKIYGVPSDRKSKLSQLPSAVIDAIRKLPGQALHAHSLGFEHPLTGRPLAFSAPPPELFQDLLDIMSEHVVNDSLPSP